MSVTISGYAPEAEEAIKEAAMDDWEFEHDRWTKSQMNDGRIGLSCHAESYLCFGESEQTFTRRLIREIWAANGGFCEVTVQATCLEEVPYKEYSLDRNDYERWKQESESGVTEQEARQTDDFKGFLINDFGDPKPEAKRPKDPDWRTVGF